MTVKTLKKRKMKGGGGASEYGQYIWGGLNQTSDGSQGNVITVANDPTQYKMTGGKRRRKIKGGDATSDFVPIGTPSSTPSGVSSQLTSFLDSTTKILDATTSASSSPDAIMDKVLSTNPTDIRSDSVNPPVYGGEKHKKRSQKKRKSKRKSKRKYN